MMESKIKAVAQMDDNSIQEVAPEHGESFEDWLKEASDLAYDNPNINFIVVSKNGNTNTE